MICVITILLLEAIACALLAPGAPVLGNVGFVLQRLPSFVCGWFIGKYAKERTCWDFSTCGIALAAIIALVAWKLAARYGVNLNFLITVVGLLLAARFIGGLALTRLGAASLESYLFNIYLLALFRDAFGWGGALDYACVCLLVVASSILIHKFNDRVVNRLEGAV